MSFLISVEKSILRILKTPKGTRVMRPEFGSELYKLRDRKMDPQTILLLSKYTYEAIKKWEPRVSVEKVNYIPNGDSLTLDISLKDRAIKVTL